MSLKYAAVSTFLLAALACNAGQAAPSVAIGLMGDSYGSGEGAPDTNGNCAAPNVVAAVAAGTPVPLVPCSIPPTWAANAGVVGDDGVSLAPSDFRCHRSNKTGTRVAVGQLVSDGTFAAARFVSSACSGAVTTNLFSASGGSGSGAPPGGVSTGIPFGTISTTPPTTLTELDALANFYQSTRRIDAIFISVGGNDFGFPSLVSLCAMNAPDINCGADPSPPFGLIPVNIAAATTAVTGGYATIANDIAATLKGRVGNVIVLQYPDPTRDGDGKFCGPPLLPKRVSSADNAGSRARAFANNLIHGEGLGDPHPMCHRPLAGQPLDFTDLVACEETQFVSETFVPALNGAVASSVAAEQALGRGWHLVSGHLAPSAKHGFCAADPWFNNLRNDLRIQGNVNGTLHPNVSGYLAYADAIKAKLKELVPPAKPDIVRFDCQDCADTKPVVTASGASFSWIGDASGATLVQVADLTLTATTPAAEADGPPGLQGDSPTQLLLATTAVPLNNWKALSNLVPAGTGFAPATTGWRVLTKSLPLGRFFLPFNNGTHIFAVRNCTPMSCSDWSKPQLLSNAAPWAVRDLHGEMAGDNPRIHWQAPFRGEVVAYEVSYTRVLGATATLRLASDQRDATLQPLATTTQLERASGPIYKAKMRACGQVLCSPWSPVADIGGTPDVTPIPRQGPTPDQMHLPAGRVHPTH